MIFLSQISDISLSNFPNFLSGAPALEFRQHWRDSVESQFRLGTVHLGYDDESLGGYAVLQDQVIGNRASKKGDVTWEMGDLFEIFIKRGDCDDYWELHVTPENYRLALHLPLADKRVGITIAQLLENFEVELPSFESCVWVEPNLQQWRVAWRIPWKTFGEGKPGQVEWKMNFGRYDYYLKGEKPTLSSTSPLTQPNFHRIEEWPEYNLFL